MNRKQLESTINLVILEVLEYSEPPCQLQASTVFGDDLDCDEVEVIEFTEELAKVLGIDTSHPRIEEGLASMVANPAATLGQYYDLIADFLKYRSFVTS